MTPNPFINALAALSYVTLVASIMFYGSHAIGPVDGLIVPVSFLSLFVLSAAMMGYFFLYQPLRFLFEGKPEEATKLFLSTVAVFACTTGAAFLLLATLNNWL